MSSKYLYAQLSSMGWSESKLEFDTLVEYIEHARQRSDDKWGTYAVFDYDAFYDECRDDYEIPLVICHKGVIYKP